MGHWILQRPACAKPSRAPLETRVYRAGHMGPNRVDPQCLSSQIQPQHCLQSSASQIHAVRVIHSPHHICINEEIQGDLTALQYWCCCNRMKDSNQIMKRPPVPLLKHHEKEKKKSFRLGLLIISKLHARYEVSPSLTIIHVFFFSGGAPPVVGKPM